VHLINLGRTSVSNIDYPAAYGGLICVAVHDDYGKPLPISSIGMEVDILAPGT
jgi:hypothetical protein